MLARTLNEVIPKLGHLIRLLLVLELGELNEIFPLAFPNHDRVVFTLLRADEMTFGRFVYVVKVMGKQVLFATIGKVRVLFEACVLGFKVRRKVVDCVQLPEHDRQVVAIKQMDRVPAVEMDHERRGAANVLIGVRDGEAPVNVPGGKFFAGLLSTVSDDDLVERGASEVDADRKRNRPGRVEKYGATHP